MQEALFSAMEGIFFFLSVFSCIFYKVCFFFHFLLGRTTIMIAHRLATVVYVTRSLFLSLSLSLSRSASFSLSVSFFFDLLFLVLFTVMLTVLWC